MSSQVPGRSRSGRDSKKAEAQRISLGSESVSWPISQQEQMYNLVVCGATDPEEGFIFSDFMGYCMALKERGVGGDFYSCFPLEEHFSLLSKRSPIVDVIKFGSYGPDKKKCLYSYSRHTFVKREYWWKQIGPNVILDAVRSWIADKQQRAKKGDAVNVILEGHGHKSQGYKIGNDHLHPYVCRDLLAGFSEGVHVNMISGACYSGRFADVIRDSAQHDRYVAAASPPNLPTYSCTRSASNRIRNSRFAQAFVQSLAKINLPGVPRKKITWRLADHEAFMREQLTRNITPGGEVVEPQFYAAEPIDGMTAVEEMIFRDKIDVLYDPSVSARRRRIEWPTLDPTVRNLIHSGQSGSGDAPAAVSSFAKAVVDSELAKCDTRMGFKPDIPVFNQVYYQTPNYRTILRNLYWRGRRQSTIWDVFELLVSRGFLDSLCLCLPVDLHGGFDDVANVSRLFCYFSLCDRDDNLVFSGQIPLQSTAWDADILWLATMIVRSGVQLTKLFETIEASEFLGKFVAQGYDHFYGSLTNVQIDQNPGCRKGELEPDGSVKPRRNQFGFWLPHGISSDPQTFAVQVRECKQRFNRIEAAFRESEGLSHEALWLESEQALFFERHPERYPSRKHDIPDEFSEWTN